MMIKLQTAKLLGFRLTGSFDQRPQIGPKVGGKGGGGGGGGGGGSELPPSEPS
jgi:hypothetical protein